MPTAPLAPSRPLRLDAPAPSLEASSLAPRVSLVRDYCTLTKLRLSSLVVATTGAGFVLAASPVRWDRLAGTLAATLAASLGACALNQVLELSQDGAMERTRERPLPAGRMSREHALLVACVLLDAGALGLAVIDRTAAALAVLVALLYGILYTPLKRVSALSVLVGAVCGALPPVLGWSAAAGRLDAGALALFAVLFAWQVPHFLAIDWMHREDYARGGFRTLATIDPTGRLTGRFALLGAAGLVGASLLVPASGVGGAVYLGGAAALGLALVGLAVRLCARPSRTAARALFLGTLAYVPLLLGLLVLDPGL